MPPQIQAVHDSLRIVAEVARRLHPAGDSAYVALLEKTNQQLGLWSNPYAVMVATLAVLVAVLAIAAVALVYGQSSEFRKRNDDALAQFRTIVETFVAKAAERLDAQIVTARSEIAGAEKTQRATEGLDRAAGDQRIVQLEARLRALDELRAQVDPAWLLQINPWAKPGPLPPTGASAAAWRCPECGSTSLALKVLADGARQRSIVHCNVCNTDRKGPDVVSTPS
ncbi:MAG: hypothetical protein ACYCVL_15190 [Gemmatimonadaceae bacterium]